MILFLKNKKAQNEGTKNIKIIYIKDNEIKLNLNEYEVEDKIVERYKDMLMYLMNDAQKELLKNTKANK